MATATTTLLLGFAAFLAATPSRAADPACKTGILSGEACCLKSCTRCGGPNCGTLPGGSAGCCSGSIIAHADSCANYGPPCVVHKAAPPTRCGDFPAQLKTDRPNVMLIGDSISMPVPYTPGGYGAVVQGLLSKRGINVWHNGGWESGGQASNTVKGLMCTNRSTVGNWMNFTGTYDVIHFNFGLHDLVDPGPGEGAEHVSIPQYQANLVEIYNRLAPRAKHVIWATTTPCPNVTTSMGRTDAKVEAYNSAALTALTAASKAAGSKLLIDDLYAAVDQKCGKNYKSCSLQRPKNVHFEPAGCDFLGQHVAKSIEAAVTGDIVRRHGSSGEGARQEQCFFIGDYEGSEDISLWQDGIAFASSGLFPSQTQGGLMLGIDLKSAPPRVHELELRGMPSGFGFRPHGIYIDNITQRLFAISHSELLREESIVVFSIEPHHDAAAESSSGLPVLVYLFALVSNEWPWFPAEDIWFLNDLAILDGRGELLTTQFGPTGRPLVTKHLWHCRWDETDIRPDGRLLSDCAWADPSASIGLNGMNINADKSVVWANDLFLSRLWVWDRDIHTGQLTRRPNYSLPGVIDNVEYDAGSGDLAMGLITLGGGALVARRLDDYNPFVKVDLAGSAASEYSVSTSLEWDRWILLGSPGDLGPVVCDMQ